MAVVMDEVETEYAVRNSRHPRLHRRSSPGGGPRSAQRPDSYSKLLRLLLASPWRGV